MENDTNPIDVQKHLKGIEFPASKDELIEQAQTNNAPEEVMDMLDGIEEKDYQNVAEVSEALSDSENEEDDTKESDDEASDAEDDDSEEDEDEEESEDEAA